MCRRAALEKLCARDALAGARELYAEDFIDHVDALDSRGRAGIAKSVAPYSPSCVSSVRQMAPHWDLRPRRPCHGRAFSMGDTGLELLAAGFVGVHLAV